MSTTDRSATESSERELIITRVFHAPRELVDDLLAGRPSGESRGSVANKRVHPTSRKRARPKKQFRARAARG